MTSHGERNVPMSTIADVAQALQSVFTTQADAVARRTGFVQRQSKLTGAAFAQTLVFGWLGDPQASLDALAQAAAAIGVPISPARSGPTLWGKRGALSGRPRGGGRADGAGG